jgi:hypothetical protein
MKIEADINVATPAILQEMIENQKWYIVKIGKYELYIDAYRIFPEDGSDEIIKRVKDIDGGWTDANE